ncbi:hypothetical protein [Streptomyces coffeae]|uniref:Uncharacterized protein n=1 Tax=Streptomyces coffeae TaxID=621382 RepID=A0ABS1NIU8_9ACTN|nr:hypothetical protein [Streptomyces coffeae]MBL1099701.1 hypothetical protein [Streptomyces coffeae]
MSSGPAPSKASSASCSVSATSTGPAAYQHIPTFIDERLTAAGATPLLGRGAADASGNFARAADQWTGDLWAALLARYGAPEGAPRPGPRR